MILIIISMVAINKALRAMGYYTQVWGYDHGFSFVY